MQSRRRVKITRRLILFDIVDNINRISASAEPIFVDVKINNQQLAMEVDTGARVSIIPASQYSKLSSISIY